MMLGNFFYRFLRGFVALYFKAKYRITVYNREKLPKKYSGGYIIACNHRSYSDPPAIAAVVKGRFSFMAKVELFKKSRFFAFIIRMCGAFPVERGSSDNSAIERAISDLKKGKVFVIFPEGTRSKDGTIGKGKSGVALIAATAGVSVLPVCIMYGLGGSPKNLDFAVGDMIPADEVAVEGFNSKEPKEVGAGRRELKRVSERIMNSIRELQGQILENRGETIE
ncbi:MAG: 1-acyl-sn-glycerol-3-phosphate acyltransferase [Oscillospiraceae bacterium]|nr:1-acyl-sn-glycerol-3-phosphate acyltransferase [Oscillospiraceae bacterium]